MVRRLLLSAFASDERGLSSSFFFPKGARGETNRAATVAAAGNRRREMYGPQRPRLLDRSRVLDSGAAPTAQRPLRADPCAHARALIESFGYRSALQIARNNAHISRWREDYWPRVLAAVQEQNA
jgi:hypothetical protein